MAHTTIGPLRHLAGTARLTACLRSLGLVDSVGIDCTMPTRSIIKLDLLQPSHLQLVKDLITNRACVYVHFAPPCGTASRARLIQYSDGSMPPPLRNDDYPNGLPWLTEDQQERVNKANQLYHIACELIVLCQENSILWSCENPGRSFMWQIPRFNICFPPLSASPLKCTIACSGLLAENWHVQSTTYSPFTSWTKCVIISTSMSLGMSSSQLRWTRMHTASHACFHQYSAMQKPATTGARI